MSRAQAADPGVLSVVVIGRNEGERLPRCLDSVAAFDAPGLTLEILYVDSHSSDDSLSIAAHRGARTIALTQGRTTAALARNAGWRAARGQTILFLDGDTILHPAFVAQALPAFADTTMAVLWGHRRELFPRRSLYLRVLDLDWIYAPGFTSFCGGDALFRRAALEQAGGFDETLIAGEEPELCRRLTACGWRILHLDLPMTGHDLAVTSFGPYWRRATRAGHAFAEVSERFRASAEPFWLVDARRNRTRAGVLLAAPLLAGVASLAFASPWPLALLLPAFALLAARTAWKARWKTGDRLALGLYGLHSHLQQVPIFVGQMQFFLHRRRGTQAGLVEYKQL